MHNLKIIIASFLTIGIMIFFAPNELYEGRGSDNCIGFKIKLVCFGLADDGNVSTLQRKINFLQSPNKFCGTSGMAVPTMAKKCCEGLSEMWNTCAENDCKCEHSLAIPGGLGICSECGNGICDKNNNEDYCNCPNDCELSTSGTKIWAEEN